MLAFQGTLSVKNLITYVSICIIWGSTGSSYCVVRVYVFV